MKNPLLNSIIWGLIYFVFTLMLNAIEASKLFYMILMLVLPGITFPISTSYFIEKKGTIERDIHYLHLILSVAVYYSATVIFFGDRYFKFSPIIAGFYGSILYLIITKYLLSINLKWKWMFIIALISGVGFGGIFLIKETIGLGLGLLIWTTSNGFIIDKANNYPLSQN